MKGARKIVVMIAIYCFFRSQIDVNDVMRRRRRRVDEVFDDVDVASGLDVDGEHSSLLLFSIMINDRDRGKFDV